MKNFFLNILLITCSLVFITLITEISAQIYVYNIAKKGKLFEVNKTSGWSVIPNLDIQRKNANGALWRIKTNIDGYRGLSSWESDQKKMLILGDSFAFGEGVNIEDRFDMKLSNNDYSILNTGVMGFGTDQQLLKSKPYFDRLGDGDVLIVLTYFNDFYDISRKQHSGRIKPWFSSTNGELILHNPAPSMKDFLREKSYIYSKLSSIIAKQDKASGADINNASKIYSKIIDKELENIRKRNVRVILAYHGMTLIQDSMHKTVILDTLNTLCKKQDIECLNIDNHFTYRKNSINFLNDGHWSIQGHKLVGSLLNEKLK